MPETPKNEKPTLSKRDNLLMALKYLMCTAGAGIIQFVSFTLLNAAAHFDRLPVFLKLFPGAAVTELKYGPSYFVALALSVIFNFTANRKYTFRSANNVPIAMAKVLGYYLVFTPLSIWWGEALAQHGWNEFAILVPTMLVNGVRISCDIARQRRYGISLQSLRRIPRLDQHRRKVIRRKSKAPEGFLSFRRFAIYEDQTMCSTSASRPKMTPPA